MMHQMLSADFFLRTDVVQIAQELLGKIIVTKINGQITSARISETEAYKAPEDKASHAYNNRLTNRTSVMFQEGGCSYVYLCYGIHSLFNVVTGPEGAAHAVLIRAAEPLEGVEWMWHRRNIQPRPNIPARLTTGPGAIAQALGITREHNRISLLMPESPVWIVSDGFVANNGIACGPRIGVDYAEECAAWPWRFWLASSPFVSKGKMAGANQK